MGISQQIEVVYKRALELRKQATTRPFQPDLLEQALKELYFVLEELRTSDEDLHQQNQALMATRHEVELERQRYYTLFELAPDGYLVTDHQGKIYHANRAAAALFDLPQDDLVGQPLVVLIAESGRSQLQQRLTNPDPHPPWEVSLNRRQGDPLTVAIVTTYLKDPRHQSITILWSLRDITHRQQIEQQLQIAHNHLEQRVAERTAELAEANARLRQEIDERHQIEQTVRDQAALIDIATDAIFVQDQTGQIQFWSRGAECLYGWTATEALGQTADDLLAVTPASPALAISRADGKSWQGEVIHQTKVGQPITVLSRQTQVPKAVGFPNATLVVNTDITEKKQLEEQFFQSQRLESLGTIASSITHDLNNILSPLLVIPQILLKRLPDIDPPTQAMIETLISSAKRGVALVQQILAFAGKLQAEPTQLPMTALLQEIQQFVNHTFPKAITLQVEIAPDLNPVWADGTLIYQVFMNLCINARDAMPNGGTLSISTQNLQIDSVNQGQFLEAQVGPHVLITIADTGLGIAPDLIDQIFDPFFTTKPAGQGTGLGLSTAAKIVKDCGGFIRVARKVDGGSQFQVYLPASHA